MLCGTRAISARSVGICDGVPSTARSSFKLLMLLNNIVKNFRNYELDEIVENLPCRFLANLQPFYYGEK